MILHAGNGLVLTQSADIPTKDRLFLPHVQLHDVEEIKDWKEIAVLRCIIHSICLWIIM